MSKFFRNKWVTMILALITVVSTVMGVKYYTQYKKAITSVDDAFLAVCQDARSSTSYDYLVSDIGTLFRLASMEGENSRLGDTKANLSQCHALMIAHRDVCKENLDLLYDALGVYVDNPENVAGFELRLQSFMNRVEDAL